MRQDPRHSVAGIVRKHKGKQLAPMALLAVAALGAVALAPTGATAADPSGTVVVTSGPSAYGQMLLPLGTTSSKLIYSDAKGDSYLTPLVGTGPVQKVPGAFGTVVGDMISYYVDGSERHWLNTATMATGLWESDWTDLTPTGGLWTAPATSGDAQKLQVFSQDAVSHVVTDLGTIPTGGTSFGVLSGLNGALFNQRYYVKYDGSGYSTLNLAGLDVDHGFLYCMSLVGDALGCAFSNFSGSSPSYAVVRLSLSGAAPVITPVVSSPLSVAVTAGYTVWNNGQTYPLTDDSTVATVPAAGGSVVTQVVPGMQPGVLTSNATTVFLTLLGPVGKAGVAELTGPATTPLTLRVTADVKASLTSGPPVLGPGSVAWLDDTAVGGKVWNASVTSGTQAPTVGTKNAVGAGHLSARGQSVYALEAPMHGFTPPVHVSGIRTSNGLDLSNGLPISDGSSIITIPGVTSSANDLSGTRVLYVDGASGHTMVYDLVRRTSVDITALGAVETNQYPPSPFGPAAPLTTSLWGNYVSFVKADGSVWRKDLSSSAVTQIVSADANPLADGRTFTWGDWVLWRVVDAQTGPHSGYVNVVQGVVGQPKVLTSVPYGVSAAGITVGAGANYEIQPWDGGTTIPVPWAFGNAPSISGSLVGWLDADNLPRIAPLGVHVVDRPRSLGNPFVTVNGSSWSVDLPTSSPLTSCSVAVRNAAGAGESFPCEQSAMARGEARGGSAGASASPLPGGEYTWTVTASNADGSLIAADGSSSAVTGKITLTGPTPTPTPTPKPTPKPAPPSFLDWLFSLLCRFLGSCVR